MYLLGLLLESTALSQAGLATSRLAQNSGATSAQNNGLSMAEHGGAIAIEKQNERTR